MQRKGSNGPETLEVGAVINCTGPTERWLPAPSGLFHQLGLRGMIVADEVDMGIQVDSDFSVLDAQGKRSDVLFAIGSLLKGTLWESTAVPELRVQAFRLAETIANREASVQKTPRYEFNEDVLEYSI